MKRYLHGKGVLDVSEGRQLDNGRYRVDQRHIGRTALEGEDTAVGMAAFQRKKGSRHNEASRWGSIARSGMVPTQRKMANADYFVQPLESDGTM